MSIAARRVGRPSKGDRRLLTFRLDVSKADLIRELASVEGLCVSDYLAHVVSELIDGSNLGAVMPHKEAERAEDTPSIGQDRCRA